MKAATDSPRKDAHNSSVPPSQTLKPNHSPGPRTGTRREASVGRAGGGIITATGEEGREFMLSLGADDYFSKPFPPTELLRTVERVLEGPSETTPAES